MMNPEKLNANDAGLSHPTNAISSPPVTAAQPAKRPVGRPKTRTPDAKREQSRRSKAKARASIDRFELTTDPEFGKRIRDQAEAEQISHADLLKKAVTQYLEGYEPRKCQEN
jgi:hypothetical protein